MIKCFLSNQLFNEKNNIIFFIIILIFINKLNVFASFDSPSFITNQSPNSINIQKKIGDISAVTIHLTAISLITINKDKEGLKEYFFSTSSTFLSTYILKVSTQRERPDKSNSYSFPSSHTSLSFSGATFIQKRYGYKYGIPAYLLATFVGYSRIASQKHYTSDVLFGAALGFTLSTFFTSKYQKINISPIYTKNSLSVNINYKL